MSQYTYKQPVLPAPAPPPRRRFPFKKTIILLLAAGLGSAYHSLTSDDGFLSSLTDSGSLYEVFQKLRPNSDKDENLLEENAAPLMKAAASGDEKTVKKLLNEKINVDARDSKRRTALMIAAYKGEKSICSLLIEAGANVSLQDKKEQNALDYAAANGLIETVRLLIEQGRKPDSRKSFEYAVLMRASIAGDASMLPKNESKTYDKLNYINRLSVEGRSPLHIVASNGSFAVAKYFLERGANANLLNNSQQTPLHFAAWNDNLELISLLLENGAKINSVDKSGNTPLMFAAARGNSKAVDLLIRRGASKNMRNNGGDDAASLASKKGFDDIADLLKTPKRRK